MIEANHVTKAYGDKLLFDDLNFSFLPMVIGIVLSVLMVQVKTTLPSDNGADAVDKGEFEVGDCKGSLCRSAT